MYVTSKAVPEEEPLAQARNIILHNNCNGGAMFGVANYGAPLPLEARGHLWRYLSQRQRHSPSLFSSPCLWWSMTAQVILNLFGHTFCSKRNQRPPKLWKRVMIKLQFAPIITWQIRCVPHSRKTRTAGLHFSQSNLGSIMSLFGLFCLRTSVVIRPGSTNHGQPVLNLEQEIYFFCL